MLGRPVTQRPCPDKAVRIDSPAIDAPTFERQEQLPANATPRPRYRAAPAAHAPPGEAQADCFKYRNRIGLDVALEALRNYRARRGARFQKVLEDARVCRVENAMRPYRAAVVGIL